MNLENLTKLRNEIKELKQKAAQAAKDGFSKYSKELFVEHPKLESFSWTQYTPYFNDGDECVFSARTKYIEVVFDGEEFEDANKWDFGEGYGEKYKVNPSLTDYQKALRDIFEFLGAFDDDDFKDIFDDHVRVIVTKDGVETDWYDHD